MGTVTRLATLACLALVLSAAVAPMHGRAQPSGAAREAGVALGEGKRLYGELDFAGAVEALRRALGVPGIPDNVRIEALEYLGAAFAVLDRPAQAREAFLEMLRMDPYHVLREPSGSPKITEIVEAVRASLVTDAALDPETRLRATLPRSGTVGRPLEIVVRNEGRRSVASVRVFSRGSGDEGWAVTAATRVGETFRVTLPARDAPDELELYAEARDTRNRVVARAGEPFTPLGITIRGGGAGSGGGGPDDGASGSIFSRWWFWTIVGAIVAGATVGIVLVTTSGTQAPAGTLPPGRVELP